jgi:plasmid stability protein
MPRRPGAAVERAGLEAVPKWIHNGSMATVTLSVKHVPRDLAKRLKARAARHHRSLQGELLAILTEAAAVTTVGELSALVTQLGLRTPAESAAMLRDDRDARRR